MLAKEPSALHIVGIGASAGGLDPIEKFFDNLPRDPGMAFVIIQHLSPDFKSLMDELLARHTDMPIHLVEDGMVVEANHVYLIPSRKEMVISEGRLLLSDRGQRELALPIDVFFRSLAQDCGSRAVAIVMSGGGSDGSRGIRDVREAGGLVIVQDTESAQFDGMPKTAREAGVAQWVLAPEDMPSVLLEHLRSPEVAAGAASASPGLAAVYRMLQVEFGLDFTLYKPTTVTRRIERRLALASSPDLDEYVARLKKDRGELDVLYRDLLIGVTCFFRDEQAFDLLEQRILPDLLTAKPTSDPLRVWVAGCATGEEAYSIAIVLLDLMAKLGDRPVKIFATDVHRGSLERATRGIYPPEAVAKVSPERLERYFVRAGDNYQVVAEVRQLVVFAAHDVIKDAPFTRVDLVSCRNMLIYLQPSAQQKVLSLFHFALNKDGVLLLGPSESPGALAKDFVCLDKHWKVYRKHADTRMHVELARPRISYADPRTTFPSVVTGARPSIPQLLTAYDALLDVVMPASLLVNEHGELVHVFGGASRFLRARDGRQGSGVLEAVDGELRMILTGGIRRALAEPQAVSFKGVRLETNGKAGVYTVTLRRVPGKATVGPHVLVSIEQADASADAADAPPQREVNLDEVSRQQLATLEAELGHTKESLQAAIEELQSTNEELQASNEELQASNEELQSTNEELQSVNEELYTVNAEYQRKITELTELTNDMDNLLASTAVGTIFLDKELVIRKFTPQIAETFSLMPHDVGRSIETFANKLDHPELVLDMRKVALSQTPVEQELRVRGKSLFLRILPYRVRGKTDGVVLTVIDVSSLKAAEDALFHERYLLNSLMAGVPDAIYFKDAHGKFIRANGAMAARLGLPDPKAAVGRKASEMPMPEAALILEKDDEKVLATGQAQHYQLESRVLEDGNEAWDLTTRLPLFDGAGRVVGIIVISRNVTEQKRAEERAKEAVRRRDQFLAMLSHELRNPLGAIVSATTLVRQAGSGAPAQAAHAIEVMDRQSRQMARLLDDLLEVSRVTQNKIELRKERLDLAELVADTATSAREMFENAGLGFTFYREEGTIPVDADPARLQQVVVNLLGNAAKYTPRGGQVRISVGRDGGEAVIRVKDTGTGLARKMLDSVFDLFVQATRTLDRSAGGIGVGLTLVRSLVTMHGGSVEAQSEGVGKGAEFIVRLPIASEKALPSADQKPSVSRVRVRVPDKARVVVVEDNADSREMLCEILALSGYECKTAANGTEALALIARVKPAVAFIDIGLPEMDGYEVARRIRDDPQNDGVWLVALTGYGQTADRVASKEAGFDEHIVKPVQTEEILRRLAQMHGVQDGPVSTAPTSLGKLDGQTGAN